MKQLDIEFILQGVNTEFAGNDFNEKTLGKRILGLSYLLYEVGLMLFGLKWLMMMSCGEDLLFAALSYPLLLIIRPVQVISQNQSLLLIIFSTIKPITP